MMVLEIAAGLAFGSMALLADGWHMATHVAALSITAVAYWYARRHADNPRYSFGTRKVGVLGGFASAVALVMALESAQRFFADVTIRFPEAIGVAVVGLVVNLISAALLHDHDHHDHDHHGHDHHGHDYHGHDHAHHDHHDHDHPGHAHDHGHGHDHNLRAAYLHGIAELEHVSVEVHACASEPCLPRG